MNLSNYKALTFDCYGTLIDWEQGIVDALQPLFATGKVVVSRDEALEAFAQFESDQEAETPGALYPDILGRTHERLAEHWGIIAAEALHTRFGASVPDWPAFEDSAEALSYLQRHYKLVILSNVDRKSFAASNRRLGIAFDAVYTAEDIGSYKPDSRNFDYLLDHIRSDLGVEPDRILHTAQSLFHDHGPANRVGLATAWIDRRGAQEGSGATKPLEDVPPVDFRFDSMAAMVQAHQDEITS